MDLIDATYESHLNMLSERLRKNWLGKMNDFEGVDDSLTNLNWLYVSFMISSSFLIGYESVWLRNRFKPKGQ